MNIILICFLISLTACRSLGIGIAKEVLTEDVREDMEDLEHDVKRENRKSEDEIDSLAKKLKIIQDDIRKFSKLFDEISQENSYLDTRLDRALDVSAVVEKLKLNQYKMRRRISALESKQHITEDREDGL